MSGERRLLTIIAANASNLSGPSSASRFSTLNVAIASWPGLAAAVTSRAIPPEVGVPIDVTSSLKFPKS